MLDRIVDDLEQRLENLDPFYLRSCDDAVRYWHPDWHACPVCGNVFNLDGSMVHKTRELMVN